ncbi:MAG TPA: sn-glycerol-3-phosphate ABC transporter ATP-binding protein UgpC [Devosiaceae bacterium]|nr:sn-glycerol-3-phosphate ABC transporter ATP-binding protein UgpC [Devosiaceae bacterium]
MATLQIDKVSKHFEGAQVLKGIDLMLDDGEFLVLLGPSGCGKSTLLSIIAGLLEPTSGDVRIGERSVVGVHPKNRDIAMVFQSYALYPNMTVRRNIGFGLEMRKVARPEREAAVARAAKILQIEPLLDRRPAELSGGQRQRVAIGRALVRNPAVFLFDEPLSNLDAKLRMEMRVELRRLHELLGTTIVYVTHDQIEAMTLATRIAVMRDGRIEQLGTPSEIYDRPANLYVAGFVGSPAINLLEATVVDGLTVQLAEGGQTVSLSSDQVGRMPASGTRVLVGVRPEAFGLVPPETPGAITATIEDAELTGPEKLVLAKLGNARFTASIDPHASVAAGTTGGFVIDGMGASLFDPDTGQRL